MPKEAIKVRIYFPVSVLSGIQFPFFIESSDKVCLKIENKHLFTITLSLQLLFCSTDKEVNTEKSTVYSYKKLTHLFNCVCISI